MYLCQAFVGAFMGLFFWHYDRKAPSSRQHEYRRLWIKESGKYEKDLAGSSLKSALELSDTCKALLGVFKDSFMPEAFLNLNSLASSTFS